jgi:hypothetical protein
LFFNQIISIRFGGCSIPFLSRVVLVCFLVVAVLCCAVQAQVFLGTKTSTLQVKVESVRSVVRDAKMADASSRTLLGKRHGPGNSAGGSTDRMNLSGLSEMECHKCCMYGGSISDEIKSAGWTEDAALTAVLRVMKKTGIGHGNGDLIQCA